MLLRCPASVALWAMILSPTPRLYVSKATYWQASPSGMSESQCVLEATIRMYCTQDLSF